MNCLFCQKDISNCKYKRALNNPFDLYKCHECNVNFQTEINTGKLHSYSFWYTRYYLTFWPQIKYFEILKIYDVLEDVPQLVLHLDFLPNINPTNVAQKLPLILTFL